MLTQAHSVCDTVRGMLNSEEDLGRMFRGLAAHHQTHAAVKGFAGLPPAATRGYPVLRLLAQVAELGVSLVDTEGELTIRGGRWGGPEVDDTIRYAVEMEGRRADFLAPLWAIGIHEMREVITNGGRDLVCVGDLRRHVRSSTAVGPPQMRALRSLATILTLDGRRLRSDMWIARRGGELKERWRGLRKMTVDEAEAEARVEEELDAGGVEEQLAANREAGEPTRLPRPRRNFSRVWKGAHHVDGYRTGRENKRRALQDTSEGRQFWQYREITAKRSVREQRHGRVRWVTKEGVSRSKRRRVPEPVGAAQHQWLVHWLGMNAQGAPWQPSWEPRESFGLEDDPDAIMEETLQASPTGLTPVLPRTSNKPFAFRRVEWAEPTDRGEDRMATGVLLPDPHTSRKRSNMYVLRPDGSDEDEAVDMTTDSSWIRVIPTDEELRGVGPGTRYSPVRAHLRAALETGRFLVSTEPVAPGTDLVASGEWRVIEVVGHGDRVRVYSPSGRPVGVLDARRLQWLGGRFRRYELHHPEQWAKLRPASFLAEIGALFARYETGQTKGDGSSVDMNMHWGTPTALRDAVRVECGAEWELFASPLNCDLGFRAYCSAHPRDVLFGARHDAYGTRWDRMERVSGRYVGVSAYLNPEYTPAELAKALAWAIAASMGATPFSAIGVYPKWHRSAYMNLLGHPNVRLVIEYQRDTFAFIPPDGIGRRGGRAARWPVMVLEVTNEEGRKQYRREGYKERIAAAGERCGARRATGAGAAFRDWEAGTSWWDLVPTRGVEAGEGATSEEGETHVGTSRVEAETRGSLRPSNPRPVTHRASGGTLRYGDAWGVWKRGEDPWARQVAMRQRRNAEGLPPLPETRAAAAATAAAAARAEAVAAAGERATAVVTRERTARAAAAAAAFETAADGPDRAAEETPVGGEVEVEKWRDGQLAHVSEGTQLYSDGSKIGGKVGAGLYCATSGREWTMKVAGPQTVNRAELTAILHAVCVARVDLPLVLYTDSKVSLDKISAWVMRPGAQVGDKHADIVEEICTRIAQHRPWAVTKLLKVPAHTGVEGNERADKLAKKAALDEEHPETNPQIGPTPAHPPRFVAKLGGEELTHTKRQLRGVVKAWLTTKYGLGTVYDTIWEDPVYRAAVDEGPSGWMWRYGGDVPRRELIHVLRMRTGEFVCQSWLHTRKLCDSPACPMPGCGYQNDNWAHTAAGLCRYVQPGETVAVMNGLATERHNAACRRLASAIANGKLGRWLCLHSFGQTDGDPEGVTVPAWITDATPGLARSGEAGSHKPDFLILEGWPATLGAPITMVDGVPVVPTSYQGVAVRIVLADLTFTMDDAATRWEAAQKRKQDKYAPLVAALRSAGWLVDGVVHTICVGHRAVVPLSNLVAMVGLGIDRKEDQVDLQRALHITAARRLAGMIAQTRKMRERCGRKAQAA